MDWKSEKAHLLHIFHILNSKNVCSGNISFLIEITFLVHVFDSFSSYKSYYKDNPENWNRVVFIKCKVQLSCMGSGTGFFLPITVSKGNNVKQKSVNADQIGH